MSGRLGIHTTVFVILAKAGIYNSGYYYLQDSCFRRNDIAFAGMTVHCIEIMEMPA